MPELPEIEHLRRSLEPHLIGARLAAVDLRRAEVVKRTGGRTPAQQGKRKKATVLPGDLLAGCTIVDLKRHGKNMAIIADSGAVLGVHLGMSGQMRVLGNGETLNSLTHVHCVWEVESGKASRPASRNGSQLIFRDPRRFGGLFVFASLEQLRERHWNQLGPDALTIADDELAAALTATRRPIKAALLDQSVLAGVGNIYADEALFAARIHPLTPSHRLKRPLVNRLATEVRHVLRQAVEAGGSTLRDYVDGGGNAGGYGASHQVYGRGGKSCADCGQRLRSISVAQRTTVFCATCQRRCR